MAPKTIVSYNVNGIRAALKKDLTGWIKSTDPDLICFQETKAQPEQIPVELFEELGYKHYWFSAVKKGYSGLGILSKTEPDNIVTGMDIERFDSEGRVMRVDYGDLSVLNCYFPSGSSGDHRQAIKMDFLAEMYEWIQALKAERPHLIVVGDYNIAHTEMDIHNPKGNAKSSGFLPEEREWLSSWFDLGFTDAFRFLNPEQVQYSWWSWRGKARANNKGWRIDYQSVTNNLRDRLDHCQQLNDAVHSDHCPVYLRLK